jgi:hypothetical protein
MVCPRSLKFDRTGWLRRQPVFYSHDVVFAELECGGANNIDKYCLEISSAP